MSDFNSNAQSELAKALEGAMTSGGVVDPAPYREIDPAAGYKIQAAVVDLLGAAPLAGSKMGFKNGAIQSAPLLFVNEKVDQAFENGIGIEVELALTLGKDLPKRAQPYSRAEIVEAISSVRLGIELCRSRYVGGSPAETGVALADMMSNIGYVLGPSLDGDLLAEGATIGDLTVSTAGKTIFGKPAVHPDGDPLKTILTFVNEPPATTFDVLKAGQVITTGSLCGMLPVDAAGEVHVLLAGKTFDFRLQ